MKYKITDLMDLYEDQDCKLTPLDRNMHRIEEKKEIMEVKQSKHRFNWQQGLSVAAAAILVAGLGIGSLYLIKKQNRNRPNDATAPSDPVTISTTVPAPTEGPVSETETTPIEIWDDLESLLRKLEQKLPNDRFTKIDNDYLYARMPEGAEAFEGFLPFFSNGQTRIWQDETRILKMDVASGEMETLFTVEYGGNDYTKLGGVTANRLYLGSCDADVLEFNLWNAYSVNYQNQDRTDLAGYVSFHSQDGWTLLDSTSQDNLDGGFIVAISPKDAVVRASGVGVHDNCYYCVSCDDDVDLNALYSELGILAEEERKKQTRDDSVWNKALNFSVRKYDTDGVKTDVGSFPVTYAEWETYFYVDPENWVIWRGGYYSPLDLTTLQPLSEAHPVAEYAFDFLDPTRKIGSGIQAYFLQGHNIALCTDFGLFVFDCYGKPLFSVDFDKLFDLNGEGAVLNADNHGISCSIPESGRFSWPQQIVLRYTQSPDVAPVYRMINVSTGICHDPSELSFLEDFSKESIESNCSFEPEQASWAAGADGDTLSTVWFYVEANDENVYPFKGSENDATPTAAQNQEETNLQLNTLLSAFAEQYQHSFDVLTADEEWLADFAFMYYRLHCPNFKTWDWSISLEQANDILTQLVGLTISPEDGSSFWDGFLQYDDGIFHMEPAYGDGNTQFAIGASMDATPRERDGRIVYDAAFKVYNDPNDNYDYDHDLLQLTVEKADELVESGRLEYVGAGRAEVEYVDGSPRIVHYEMQKAAE